MSLIVETDIYLIYLHFCISFFNKTTNKNIFFQIKDFETLEGEIKYVLKCKVNPVHSFIWTILYKLINNFAINYSIVKIHSNKYNII